jgi:hypothetical protein
VIRKPLRAKAHARQQITRVVSTAAPVRGWNAKDALAAMKPGDAIRLKNWFPTTSDCVLRGGYAEHLTAVGDVVKTLAVHNAMSGTSKMFAATDAGIFDASSAGAAGASVATSTNGYWQFENYGDGTNNWLIMVNGTDKPNYYSGSAWTAVDATSTPALTGLTTTSIIHVFQYLERLFFIEKDSLSAWYLAAGAAGGALTEFDFASLASKGGFLLAGGTWSLDSGQGLDDVAVFVTSEGEVFVYRGTDPSSASTWEKLGTYQIGKPIGRRCLLKIGGDLCIITQNGVFPLSAILSSSNAKDKRLAVTDRIETAFNDASRDYRDLLGWEGIFYPARSAVLFNIPTIDEAEAKQYVMNSTTKAWCEFDSWDAMCFAVFNEDLYFGGDDTVYKAWTGTADNGVDIQTDAKEAFSKYGSDQQKKCTLYRPILSVNGSIAYLTGLDVDFKDTNITGSAEYTVTSGGQWDVSNWDEAFWQANLEVVRQWQSPKENVGTWFAGKLKVATQDLEIHWLATDIMFEVGGGI